MKPKIDDAKCIGCGACVAACGAVFELSANGKAIVKEGVDYEANKEGINQALSSCPGQAITLE